MIYDDIDIPQGTVRIRPNGSAGTHNGMRSIVAETGTEDFPRIRVGVGQRGLGWNLADWVLSHYQTAEEQEIADKAYEQAADAVLEYLKNGINSAMNRYNTKKPKKEKPRRKQPRRGTTRRLRSRRRKEKNERRAFQRLRKPGRVENAGGHGWARAGCTSVYEIAEGERPFLAAALRRKTGRPVVLLCSTELVAQRYAQDVERLTGEECGVLPPRDLQFSRAASSRESTWLRLRNLDELCRKNTRILCLSLESLLDRCVPKARFPPERNRAGGRPGLSAGGTDEPPAGQRLRAGLHGGGLRPVRHARLHSGCVPAQRGQRPAR